MKSRAMITQHGSRIIPMTIRWTAGAPSIEEGLYQATIEDTGPGIATVTFTHAFARKPVILSGVEAATGDKITLSLRNVTNAGFILESVSEAGTVADSTVDAHLLIVGFDAIDRA